MIRYLSYAAPYILKSRARNPVKKIAGLLFAYILIGLAAVFLFIAVFIWMAKLYGTESAFAAVGGTMLLLGLFMIFMLSRPKKTVVDLHENVSNDPLAKFIPDNIKSNASVQTMLQQIGENPVTATATAVTLGMLISKEFLEET